MFLGLKRSEESLMNEQEINTTSLDSTASSSQPETTSLTMYEILEITSEIRFS